MVYPLLATVYHFLSLQALDATNRPKLKVRNPINGAETSTNNCVYSIVLVLFVKKLYYQILVTSFCGEFLHRINLKISKQTIHEYSIINFKEYSIS